MDEPAALHPERALAVAYAPPAARRGLATLFALDERLERLALHTAEPTLAMIRLAWWRDQLAELAGGPPPADPLLLAARDLGLDDATLAGVAEGWEALLEDPDWSPDTVESFARQRGAGMFRLAGTLLGARAEEQARLEAAGMLWARADLARMGDQAERVARAWAGAAAAADGRWRRPLRSLGMLAVLAEEDRRRAPALRPLASRGRLLRLFAHQLTGR
jgi:phytoene synthase